jgi:uncharacterized protein (TIGR00725 family)
MKIAISGGGSGNDPSIIEKAKELGTEIAKNKHILLTGGCHGYPYAALRGALVGGGKIIAYSPGKDEQEHITKYNFPIDEGVEYIYTGLGIPERNIPLVKAADVVIILDGKIGTLNEFCIAFHEQKKIGILKTGKLPELIPKISEFCDKRGEKERIFYETDPTKLIKNYF